MSCHWYLSSRLLKTRTATAALRLADTLFCRPAVALFLQDAWCVQERLANQDMVMFGVFDGHGQEGKIVSHSVCTNVPKALAKHAACKVSMLTLFAAEGHA